MYIYVKHLKNHYQKYKNKIEDIFFTSHFISLHDICILSYRYSFINQEWEEISWHQIEVHASFCQSNKLNVYNIQGLLTHAFLLYQS